MQNLLNGPQSCGPIYYHTNLRSPLRSAAFVSQGGHHYPPGSPLPSYLLSLWQPMGPPWIGGRPSLYLPFNVISGSKWALRDASAGAFLIRLSRLSFDWKLWWSAPVQLSCLFFPLLGTTGSLSIRPGGRIPLRRNLLNQPRFNQ
jgi:hypothetical protein